MIKILHVASFTGNIGDEANHQGFIEMFKKYICDSIEITKVEMRNFYKSWNLMKFDSEFVSLCNNHDIVIIGGGNFFELCWDYSKTGTTIDIDVDTLETIRVPVIFNMLGVDDGKGTNLENIKKFKKLLDSIKLNENCIISVRNDGSYEILEKYYGSEYINEFVLKVPDGGFFFKPKQYEHIEYSKSKVNIGINIGGDMENIRFLNPAEFKAEFANFINNLFDKNDKLNVVFLPHMYKDIDIIGEILENINDVYRRERISISPLLNGNLDGGNYIFDLYNKMDLILGMRFHSNVCSIGQNIPNIGMVSYHKHGYVFDDIGLSDRKLDVKDELFFEKLYEKVTNDLENLEVIKVLYKEINEKLNEDLVNYMKVIKDVIF